MCAATPTAFGFGQFLGTYERRLDVRGFQVADITPAVADRAVPLHTHDDAHFVLVLDGVYTTSASGAPDACTAPTLVYNPAGTTHRDRFRSRTGRFLTVSVARDAHALATAQYRLMDRPACLASPEAIALGRRLAAECAASDPAVPLLVEGLCWELLAAAQPRGERMRTAPGWLLKARERLQAGASGDLRLVDVASDVGVHPIHLTRAFRRFFRCTPGDYVRRCRLERAATLLRGAELSLSEIALATGFADQSHFTRAFGRAVGVPPGAFRRGAR